MTVNRQTGKMDPGRAAAGANLIDAIISGTNGRVTTDMLLAFAKQGRTGARLLSDQGFVDMVPVIESMGGYRAGTGLTAFDRAIVGGVMTTRGTSWLERLGLINPKNVHKGKAGYVQLDPGAIAGSAWADQDPQKWADTILMPALKKAKMSPLDAMRALGAKGNDLQSMMTNILQSGLANTTNGLLAELIGNSTINSKEVTNIKQAGT